MPNKFMERLGHEASIQPKLWNDFLAEHAEITKELIEKAIKVEANPPTKQERDKALAEKANFNPEKDVVKVGEKTVATFDFNGPFESGFFGMLFQEMGLPVITVPFVRACISQLQAYVNAGNQVDELRIYLNSPGGIVAVSDDTRDRISNACTEMGINNISVYGRGLVASAAADFALVRRGTGEITLTASSTTLFHDVIRAQVGQSFDFEKAAREMKAKDRVRARSFAQRLYGEATEANINKWIALMDEARGELIWTADEAVENGYADRVIEVSETGEDVTPIDESDDEALAKANDKAQLEESESASQKKTTQDVAKKPVQETAKSKESTDWDNIYDSI